MRSTIVFFLLVTGYCAYAQPKAPTRADHGLKGDVHYIFSNGPDSLQAEYDSTGRTRYVKDNFVSCLGVDLNLSSDTWRYEYDKEGRLVSSHNLFEYLIQAPEPGEETLHTCDEFYTYNRWGQIERTDRTCSDPFGDPGETIFYTYDARGNLIAVSRHSSSASYRKDSLMMKNEYRYDRKGRQISRSLYVGSADTIELNGVFTQSYNRKGLLSGECTYDVRGKMVSATSYEYDNRGRPVVRSRYDYVNGDKKIRLKWTCVYSDSGRFETRDEYYEKAPVRTESKFNRQGDRILQRYFNEDGSLDNEFVYAYVYDAQGNWTHVTRIDKWKRECVAGRRIVYWNTK